MSRVRPTVLPLVLLPAVVGCEPTADAAGAVSGRGPGESEMYYSATLDGDRVLLLGVPGVRQLFQVDGSLLGSSPPGSTGSRPAGRTASAAWGGLPGSTDNPAFGVDARGRIHVSDTLRYRIETWDLDGRLRRVLERPVEPRAFDASWLDEMERGFEDAQRASRSVVNRDDLAEQVATATPDPLPPHLHVIENILVGPEGELWVKRADRHPRPALRAVAHQYGYIRHAWLPGWAAPRVYDVFDPEGRYEGTLRLPEGFEPMAVAGRRVYGVHYDDLDVERVVVHEVGGDG